jgi:NAD(P)-dependent dehydrogenase (short-subunit alcohol dehydrogenase family)
MSPDLTGRYALVTGGSRGLGREIACALAGAGANVIVVSRKLDSCERLASELRERCNVDARAMAAHVGRWDEIDGLVERVYDETPGLDILVNNAGMSPLYETESDVTEEMFDKVLGVNLKGPFRLTALVGERMIAQQRPGSIINVSSSAAVNPQGPVLPYAAAKAGLNNLTVAFARRLGPTVRVNALMPGLFLTDVSHHWDMGQIDAQVARYALRRVGRPEEVAGAALYLAGDESSYTSGAVIAINGGEV